MAKKYTAEEMRNKADEFKEYLNNPNHFAVKEFDDESRVLMEMLRQAANAMDREESEVVTCRKCQTERTGEGYGDVPPPIGEDDIRDRCEIAQHLRRGEKRKTRK